MVAGCREIHEPATSLAREHYTTMGAGRGRRLSLRPSLRTRPMGRSRCERGSHHGVERRTAAHAPPVQVRKRWDLAFPVLRSGAPRSMKMGTTLSPWRYDTASRFTGNRSNMTVPSRKHCVEVADAGRSRHQRGNGIDLLAKLLLRPSQIVALLQIEPQVRTVAAQLSEP